MRGISLILLSFALGCATCVDMSQVLRSGLKGEEAALLELSGGSRCLREMSDDAYGVKVHDLWLFMAARKGLASATVPIEQRTFHLLEWGISHKDDFRASLAEVSTRERNRNHELADLADAIKAAIDGDIPLANKLQGKLSASGVETLSGEEIEFLADRSTPLLTPVARGACHAMLTKGEHVYSVPVLFEIPREIYIPWATRRKNRPTVADVDLRIREASAPLRFDSRNPAEGGAPGQVLIIVCKPPYMDKSLFAEIEPALRDAIARVFSRYGLQLGRRASVEGVPLNGSGFDEIAKEILRRMGKYSE